MKSSPLVVFQGELAVTAFNSVGPNIIKTTIPSSCIVVGLYNEQKKIGALAHIDDYTDPAHAIQKMCEIAKIKFNTPCSSSYKATVLGGTDDPFSLNNKKLVLGGLKKYGIDSQIKKLSSRLSQRPQISLDVRNGELRLLEGNAINQRLEYLQRREYGEWNKWLDFAYQGVNGADIPYFEGKVATRYEENIPKFKANNQKELAETRQKELVGKLKLPISFERKPVRKHDEL